MIVLAVTGSPGLERAQAGEDPPALVLGVHKRGPVPIPPAERGLLSVVAAPWFKVSDEGQVLEGPAFERDGNLVFCDVTGRRVIWVPPTTPVRSTSLDASTDRWRPGVGGSVVTRGDLVLVGASMDRTFRALDVATGRVLYQTRRFRQHALIRHPSPKLRRPDQPR